MKEDILVKKKKMYDSEQGEAKKIKDIKYYEKRPGRPVFWYKPRNKFF